MKTKFTPGPWEAHIGLDYFSIYSTAGSCVVPESKCNPESERDVADAYLLASAPLGIALAEEVLNHLYTKQDIARVRELAKELVKTARS